MFSNSMIVTFNDAGIIVINIRSSKVYSCQAMSTPILPKKNYFGLRSIRSIHEQQHVQEKSNLFYLKCVRNLLLLLVFSSFMNDCNEKESGGMEKSRHKSTSNNN